MNFSFVRKKYEDHLGILKYYEKVSVYLFQLIKIKVFISII